MSEQADHWVEQLTSVCWQRLWGDFMVDVQNLAQRHPYTVSPAARQCCEWGACGIFGASTPLHQYNTLFAKANVVQCIQCTALCTLQAACQLDRPIRYCPA